MILLIKNQSKWKADKNGQISPFSPPVHPSHRSCRRQTPYFRWNGIFCLCLRSGRPRLPRALRGAAVQCTGGASTTHHRSYSPAAKFLPTQSFPKTCRHLTLHNLCEPPSPGLSRQKVLTAWSIQASHEKFDSGRSQVEIQRF